MSPFVPFCPPFCPLLSPFVPFCPLLSPFVPFCSPALLFPYALQIPSKFALSLNNQIGKFLEVLLIYKVTVCPHVAIN